MQADTHKHTHTLFEYPLGKPFKAKLLIFNGIRLTCWGALRKLDLEIALNGERYIHHILPYIITFAQGCSKKMSR